MDLRLRGHCGESLFCPLVEAAPESRDVPVSHFEQCPRHTGAGRFIRSGAVEDDLPSPGQGARKRSEAAGRYPPCAWQNLSRFRIVPFIAEV